MFALDLVKNSNKINGALFTNYHLLHFLVVGRQSKCDWRHNPKFRPADS